MSLFTRIVKDISGVSGKIIKESSGSMLKTFWSASCDVRHLWDNCPVERERSPQAPRRNHRCRTRRGPLLSLGIMVSSLFLSAGCTSSFPNPSSGTYQPTHPTEVTQPSPARPLVFLFGGEDHKTYLGCLTCDPDRYKDALLNADGPYGQCPCSFNQDCPSVFCHSLFATFGSTGIAENYSACSNNASDPPVLVDNGGNYYGRFSLAESFGHPDSVCAHLGGFVSEATCNTVKLVCKYENAGACDEDCESKYQSDVDDCHAQYGDDAEDVDDFATCIQNAKDNHRSCAGNCAGEAE